VARGLPPFQQVLPFSGQVHGLETSGILKNPQANHDMGFGLRIFYPPGMWQDL
jgi:hypothetical protein